MRLLSPGTLALAVGAVHAFRDTSPFFLFSTSPDLALGDSESHPQLRLASSVTSGVSSILSSCPTDLYVVVSQSGVRPADYTSTKTSPSLLRRLLNGRNQGIKSHVAINEVVGDVDVESWHDILESKCGAQIVDIDARSGIPTKQKTTPVVYNVWLPAPNAPDDLRENDAFFASIIDTLPSQAYTVLYATSPGKMSRRAQTAETGLYEMESQVQETMHIDLRRDLASGIEKRANNESLVDGPLFDRYQFLTPGLFMGFVVGFILLSIAYVGVSALASLQVSYAAFEKESGQLASKKAQ